MKYNICIPIPIKSNNLREIEVVIDRAIAFNPEFIEFRFDYIDNIENITQNFVEGIRNLIKNKNLVIFTLRHHSEGGNIKIDEGKRLKVLKILIEAHPDFLDIEMSSNIELLKNLINLSTINKVKLIFSYHNFEKTHEYQDANNIILKFKDKLTENRLNHFEILNKSIYKIIFTAQNFEDNLIPLILCKEYFNDGKKIISFCMGELGILSRILSVKLGSFLTYAALEEPTAPGQIKIHTLQQMYKLLFSD
ncbi:MAG: type I 3-dehydroquinate dehydratase [Promethearchaeota archaeon]|jgi:3-dehydroquinate dehydratase type I